MNILARHHKALFVLGLTAYGLALAASPPFDFFTSATSTDEPHGRHGRVAVVSSLPQAPNTGGVGPTAGLKGEMIQLDGELLVSSGRSDQGAVQVPPDLDQSAFEAFVQDQAVARGISLDQPFVFRVSGQFPKMGWHVVTGDKPSDGGARTGVGGHGGDHANQKSAMKIFNTLGVQGQLVGIFSRKDLEGMVSHQGERSHVHYADQRPALRSMWTPMPWPNAHR